MQNPAKLSPFEVEETAKAKVLHEKLSSINPRSLDVLTRDRHIKRTDQAKLARGLFKKMGLVGISVRTPNYSMAHTVDVRMPHRRDYVLDDHGMIVLGCEAMVENTAARTRMEAVLLAAFPRHDDRSDTMTDYFDACWSID